MSFDSGPGYYKAEAKYADLLRSVGLADGLSVFEHPKIQVWRSITERENCIFDHEHGRLHIKRNKPKFAGVDSEVVGIRLLNQAGIPSVPLAGYGMLNDRRGFLISDDLSGYEDSEKLIQSGLPFKTLLEPTAELAARLHGAQLHHRDLYLCHFYAMVDSGKVQLALIDAGRVQKIPWLFSQRWIVKDLAQFIYSARSAGVNETLQNEWLETYAIARKIPMTFKAAIESKVRKIAAHDVKLRASDPMRNVAINR